jgi:hypothetical protein
MRGPIRISLPLATGTRWRGGVGFGREREERRGWVRVRGGGGEKRGVGVND